MVWTNQATAWAELCILQAKSTHWYQCSHEPLSIGNYVGHEWIMNLNQIKVDRDRQTVQTRMLIFQSHFCKQNLFVKFCRKFGGLHTDSTAEEISLNFCKLIHNRKAFEFLWGVSRCIQEWKEHQTFCFFPPSTCHARQEVLKTMSFLPPPLLHLISTKLASSKWYMSFQCGMSDFLPCKRASAACCWCPTGSNSGW
jgi:hypothetical protein